MAALTATTSAAESLWLDTAPPPAHGPQDRDVHVDVAVIGGGIAGVTTALLLKRGGARTGYSEFAAAWDRYARGRGVRRARNDDVATLTAILRASLATQPELAIEPPPSAVHEPAEPRERVPA